MGNPSAFKSYATWKVSMQKVALDLVPLSPGRGGGGGGVTRYSIELLQSLSELCHQLDFELVVFAQPGQIVDVQSFSLVEVNIDVTGILRRLLWVHLILPVLCLVMRIDVLHKLATECPIALPGTKLVVTVHDFMTEFLSDNFVDTKLKAGPLKFMHSAYFRLIAKRALSRSNFVIVPSNSVGDEAIKRFGPRPNLYTIYNGINRPSAGLNQCAPRYIDCQAPLRIAYIASFSPHKGHFQALAGIELFAKLNPQYSTRLQVEFRGHVVDVDYHRDFLFRSSSSVLRNEIHFINYSSTVSVTDLYASADIVMLLSMYEGFGLPPAEAQAHGVPVICSDMEPFHEVLQDGALYVDSADPSQIAHAIHAVVSQQDATSARTQAGVRNSQRFTWSKTADKTARVYRHALAKSAENCR
ncbi:glycosyltransferase involved in cell wall biosynthesis [Pseudonocardia sediminis]|uniref:Glycosyltransferase involved in cell wall biosynthesis n=1 Tax=Pseudonocardia sediminis TaxID=1397368 RepID=A0A4Q7V0T3_PSEST|nr:glycosyltransferase family 1 protein [Pseudonocardia sediminis]RZT87906.1 glycosyltransferase involved in cell wall biosynthesis [Pseudonocardia sediminis]